MTASHTASSGARIPEAHPRRTSQLLREILTKNPKVKHFTVKRIIESIESSRVGTALMLFSLPKIVEVPGTATLAGVPTCLIAGQTAMGKTEFKLPSFILGRSVPRRSLAVMIHSILPMLELAESGARPRWRWMTHPSSQWVVGLVLFLLSLAVAIPILGFALPHAAAMFTVSLGMVEQDGMVIVIGLLAGLASLAVAIASALTGRSLLAKAGEWLKSFIRKLGAKWAKNLLRKINSKWANLLDLRWSKLLLFWDPEAASKFDTPLPNLIPAAKTSRLGTMIERRRKASRVSTSYGVSGRRVDRPRAEPSSRVRHEKKQAI